MVPNATGSQINAIVTQRGSRSELSSSITRDSAQVLSDDPRVVRDASGRALFSPELVVGNMRKGLVGSDQRNQGK